MWRTQTPLDRSHGAAPFAAGDGLHPGASYSGIIAAAPSGTTVQVTIPAFDPTVMFGAFIQPGSAAVVGEACVVIFDDNKHPWVLTGNWGIDAATVLGGQTPVVTTDARLTNSRTPTGAAGGDLAGNYPNPTVPTVRAGLVPVARTDAAGGSLGGTFPNPIIATGAPTSVARAFGTAYQPNAGRTTLVVASFSLQEAVQTDTIAVQMDASNPPTTAIATVQFSESDATGAVPVIPCTFLVPAGFFYRFTLTLSQGIHSVVSTYEYTL